MRWRVCSRLVHVLVISFACLAGMAKHCAAQSAPPRENPAPTEVGEGPVVSRGGHDRFVPDPQSVLRCGPAWKHPQAGWIVVHVEGTPYDRGFQHGQLLAAEIVDYIQVIASQRGPKAPAEAWRGLRTLTDALFLRGYDQESLQEMKGIADGAAAAGAKFDKRRLDLLDIVTLNSDVEVGFLDPALEASGTGLESLKFAAPQYAVPKARLKEHCSAFLATGPATADGRIVMGHITMSDLAYVRHFNVWLDIQPEQGHRIVFQTFPGGIESGMDYYITAAGLVVCETTIRQTRFDREGTPLASRIRRAVQYAASIDEFVELLAPRSNGLYTNQWLVGDLKTNEIAMVETGTARSRLWRSSRGEWPDGTAGFYWGCNNIRDREVFQETVPHLGGKPANLVRFPRSRDKAWLEIFGRYRGKIDEQFGFVALTTPPLAAFPSCDATFTTSTLASRLESWGLFGPPLGRAWEPSATEARKFPDMPPLISNDWTLLRVAEPLAKEPPSRAVDLAAGFKEEHPHDADDDAGTLGVEFKARHPFAWRGTLLPAGDGDIWLAAAFAEYEHIVALENALRTETGVGQPLSTAARDLVELALFAHESRWQTAVRRLGRDLPLEKIQSDPASKDWYDIASGKGVMLLAALRDTLGAAACDQLLDEFGSAHAGTEVTTRQFVEHCQHAAGIKGRQLVEQWLGPEVPPARHTDHIWTIYSFEAEPERALIVYGTLGDIAAQKEGAERLQRILARRFHNWLIPIRADNQVSEEELRERHLLLVGRPECNQVTARFGTAWPVSFGPASITIGDQTWANPDTWIMTATDNPLNRRYSMVAIAGLSARATWDCIAHIPDEEEEPAPQTWLTAAGKRPRRFVIADRPRPE
ncbi:MAG: C45 family autoproteolytic acyltransferase/hydrolase [Planctomycetales bacterium]